MFDLVNDIEAYPEFLDWCTGARVESSTATDITASIDIGIAGISQSFRTRNALTAPGDRSDGRISMRLVDGPFKRLEGAWRFEPQVHGGSVVGLDLEYELSFSPLKFVLGPIFDEIARSQVTAFVRRADAVYRES